MNTQNKDSHSAPKKEKKRNSAAKKTQREIGGREGLEPTRYGDWEKKGRCIDF